MCDMGGLDNLIANTAYLQARKSGDEDAKEIQKRCRNLVLPKVEECAALMQAVKAEYESICDQQPIGKHFFKEFLETTPEYQLIMEFLDEVSTWELAEDDIRSSLLEGLVNMYLKNVSNSYLSFLSVDLSHKCQSVTKDGFENVMQLAKEEAIAFFKAKPFEDFLASPFYEKFLQWKVFEQQPVSEKLFEEFRILGKGGFGEVCAVQVKTTGKMYACKKLDKKRLKKKGGEKMALLEKEILEKVNSPFIVNLAYAYQSKVHLCLVMSLMNGGDLKFHIYNVGERGLDMDRIIFYSAQITCGILHLHSIKIIYRDMKPENVLLDDDGNCRLSDLGLAVEVKEGKAITQRNGSAHLVVYQVCLGVQFKRMVFTYKTVSVLRLESLKDYVSAPLETCLLIKVFGGLIVIGPTFETEVGDYQGKGLLAIMSLLCNSLLKLALLAPILVPNSDAKVKQFDLPRHSVATKAGTNGYMAPEILKDEGYGYPVDWFAMGCSIYEMVAGQTPFKDYKEKVHKDEVKRRTLDEEVTFEHAKFSDTVKDICKLFLAKKPEDRLGSRSGDDDPTKHSFFKSISFPRLKAGLIEPPFVPDPTVVYAKDIADIADFSEVQGIEFDDKDEEFFKKFSTGAVSIPWQEEVIATGLFQELNDPNREAAVGSKSSVCMLL